VYFLGQRIIRGEQKYKNPKMVILCFHTCALTYLNPVFCEYTTLYID